MKKLCDCILAKKEEANKNTNLDLFCITIFLYLLKENKIHVQQAGYSILHEEPTDVNR